jgi:hypothetical protein
MNVKTPLCSFVYPSEGDKDFFDIYESLMNQMDDKLYSNIEDRFWILDGGGYVSLDDSEDILSWDEDFELLNLFTGAKITILAGSLSGFEDGKTACVSVSRPAESSQKVLSIVEYGISFDKVFIAVRHGSTFSIRNNSTEIKPMGVPFETLSDGTPEPQRWQWPVSRTIDGEPSQALRYYSFSGGTLCYVSKERMGLSAAQMAYGTWEGWMWKDPYENDLGFMPFAEVNTSWGQPNNAGQYGYYLENNTGVNVRFYRVDNGSWTQLWHKNITGGGWPNKEWVNVKMVRSNLGLWSFYTNDVLMTPSSGSNPVLDNTYTSGNYASLRAGHKSEIGIKKNTGQYIWTFTPLSVT